MYTNSEEKLRNVSLVDYFSVGTMLIGRSAAFLCESPTLPRVFVCLGIINNAQRCLAYSTSLDVGNTALMPALYAGNIYCSPRNWGMLENSSIPIDIYSCLCQQI